MLAASNETPDATPMTGPTPTPMPNLLLSALSDAARDELEWVHLPQYGVALEPATPPSHVYFPAGCVASLMLTLEDGCTAQAAMVGHEGMLGVDAFLGGATRVSEAITLIHVGGPAWSLPADRFRRDLIDNVVLQERLLRYTLALVSQIARTAACHRGHAVEQQLCRWLLQSLDRAPTRCLSISNESIATLLGLPREAVGTAMTGLERRGWLQLAPGGVTVLHRPALETACCECYRSMRLSEARALFQSVRPPARARSEAESVAI